jgi:hypothetical protein
VQGSVKKLATFGILNSGRRVSLRNQGSLVFNYVRFDMQAKTH